VHVQSAGVDVNDAANSEEEEQQEDEEADEGPEADPVVAELGSLQALVTALLQVVNTNGNGQMEQLRSISQALARTNELLEKVHACTYRNTLCHQLNLCITRSSTAGVSAWLTHVIITAPFYDGP
jgi:hypothetical protein